MIRAAIPILIATTGLLSACGTFQRTQYEWSKYGQARTQKHGSVKIQVTQPSKLPPEVLGTLSYVDESSRNMRVQQVVLIPTAEEDGSVFFKVELTNTTNHVLRLHDMEARLFDPADNEWEPMGKAALIMFVQTKFGDRARSLSSKVQALRLISKNTVVLPKRVTRGYLVFRTGQLNIPGVWRLVFHDVPTRTGLAGRKQETAVFEFNVERKGFRETYKRKFFKTTLLRRDPL